MANLTEAATFDASVYRIDQTDPVQGWDGANIGISNQQAQALANRTQWLKARVDLGSRFVAQLPFAPATPGQVQVLTPADMNGRLVRVDTSLADGVLTIPLASSCEDGSNIAVTVEPGDGVKFISSNGKFVVLGPSGSDTFYDVDTNQALSNYTIQPYSIVRVHKVSPTQWMVWKERAVEMAPPGIISAWAVNSQPYGWLECNGSAISRTTYKRLFDNIGTTFGIGNGTTTFNIPDLRGEFIRGWDNGRGIDAGRAFGSAQADELRAHTHTYRGATISPTGSDPTGTGATFNTGNTSSTGGAETRPRNIALMLCIKF